MDINGLLQVMVMSDVMVGISFVMYLGTCIFGMFHPGTDADTRQRNLFYLTISSSVLAIAFKVVVG